MTNRIESTQPEVRRPAPRPASQAEFLFDDNASKEEPVPCTWTEPVAEVEPEAALLEPVTVSEAIPPVRERVKPSPTPAKETYAGRCCFGSMLNIGKYLSVSGSLDKGHEPMRRMELPRKRFRARLKLWNEPLVAESSYTFLRFPPRDISRHGPRRADGNLIFS